MDTPPKPYVPSPSPGNFNPQQYDFITNPSKPKKAPLLKLGGSKNRLLILIAVGLGLLTVVLLVATLLFGGNTNDTNKLLTIAEKQQEIIRITELGTNKAGGTEAKNFAHTTSLIITSQQQKLLEQIKKSKKVSSKDLGGAKDSSLDEQLKTAELNGRFDDAFMQALRAKLEDYQTATKTTASSVTNKTAQQLLADDSQQTSLLLGQ